MPFGLGFNGVSRDGVTGECFEAVHTHDETGVLHTDFVKGNELNLGRFLSRWLPDLNLSEAKILVNGKPVADAVGVTLEPEMDIKIFRGSP